MSIPECPHISPASASGSLDADPNFPGSRDVDQDPSFVGRRPDLDPMTPQTPDDLDPAEVDRLATNYSLFPDQTGLPGEELKDPRERAEQTLRYHAEQQAAQNRRFKQIIEEQNQLYLNRPVRGSSSSGAGMDIALDALGTLDPTGLVDGYHSLTYAVRGQWSDAGLTAVGVIPFVGDSLKFAKYGRFADEAVSGIEAGARWGDEVAELATSRVSTLDFMADGRRVSGMTGHLGSPRLTRAEQLAFRDEMAAIGITVNRGSERILDRVEPGLPAAFDYSSGTIYLRSGPTKYHAFHEATHARQYVDLGRESYLNLGRYAREQHVFHEIYKNRSLFTIEETRHALDYLRDLRHRYRSGLID
jgi:hypothetical protein